MEIALIGFFEGGVVPKTLLAILRPVLKFSLSLRRKSKFLALIHAISTRTMTGEFNCIFCDNWPNNPFNENQETRLQRTTETPRC